jgi:hypothetical protein
MGIQQMYFFPETRYFLKKYISRRVVHGQTFGDSSFVYPTDKGRIAAEEPPSLVMEGFSRSSSVRLL